MQAFSPAFAASSTSWLAIAYINELFAFLVGKALVNDIFCALYIDFHHQFAALIAKRYHAGAVQDNSFRIRLNFEKTFQGRCIAQISFALLDLFGNVLGGFIARQNQCPAVQTACDKLAANLAAKVTGCAGDKIQDFH